MNKYVKAENVSEANRNQENIVKRKTFNEDCIQDFKWF